MDLYMPMLAKQGDAEILDRKTLIGYIFEPKLDGTRVIIYKDKEDVQVFNRKNEDLMAKYPELLDLAAFIKTKSCVLDGELVILNNLGMPDPKLLQQREQLEPSGKTYAKSKKQPATIFVFDIIEKDGVSLKNEPLNKRKVALKNVITEGPNLMLCPYTMHGKDLWKQIKDQKMEGMIAKELNSKYLPGERNWAWLKIKNFSTIDTAVVGVISNTKAKGKFESLLLAVYDKGTESFKYIGQSPLDFDPKDKTLIIKNIKRLMTDESPLSDEKDDGTFIINFNSKNPEENRHLKVSWLRPEMIAEIKSKEVSISGSNGIQDAKTLRLRFDKDVKECVLE
ncbi:MAG: hypothetical protein NTX24_02005 [Candidatus Pacearchaeota archaeon]|nr:hypothetical protein [Candidatus Pacearchaeota archaeon]